MCSKSSSIVFLLLLVASASALSLRKLSNTNYYFSSEAVSFPQAWAYCKSAGMKFAALTSPEREIQLETALNELGASSGTFWMGGIYLNLQKWYWVDSDQPFNYSHWLFTPNLSYSDYCIYYIFSTTPNKSAWSYTSCSTTLYFVCEQ